MRKKLKTLKKENNFEDEYDWNDLDLREKENEI